ASRGASRPPAVAAADVLLRRRSGARAARSRAPPSPDAPTTPTRPPDPPPRPPQPPARSPPALQGPPPLRLGGRRGLGQRLRLRNQPVEFRAHGFGGEPFPMALPPPPPTGA